MIKYLSNPRLWEFEWNLIKIGPQFWAVSFLLIIILWRFRHRVHRNIYLFVVFALLMDHVSTDKDVSQLLSSETNSPWYHLGTPILFLLLSRFYSNYLFKGRLTFFRWLLPLVFCLIALINALVGDGFYNFPAVTVGLYSASGILFTVSFFMYLLNSLEVKQLEKSPMFWVSTGMLIYYSGNFLVWIGMNLLTYNSDFFFSIYRISYGLTILLNCFFIIAIILKPNTD